MTNKFNFLACVGVVLLVLYINTHQALSDSIGESGASNDKPEQDNDAVPTPEGARSRFSLPRMFDFERFKSVFKRTYASIMEEAARKRLFLARALRAFISAVKYKYSLSSSYLAINGRSDWTPFEIKRLFSRRENISKKGTSVREEPSAENEISNDTGLPRNEQSLFPAINEEELKYEFKLISEHQKEPGFKQIMGVFKADKHSRKKREINRRLDLNLDDLFREPKVSEKIASDRITSNNPNYESPELRSFGSERVGFTLSSIPGNLAQKIIGSSGLNFASDLIGSLSSSFMGGSEVNQQAPQPSFYIQNIPVQQVDAPTPVAYQPAASQDKPWYSYQLYNEPFQGIQQLLGQPFIYNQQASPDLNSNFPQLNSEQLRSGDTSAKSADKLPDEVFIDHRKSNCFFPVRDQAGCGSCYAFAATALYEWLFCKQTGKKVAFSEQYLVDCGKSIGMHGCDGGRLPLALDFVNKFGLELRENYPYMGQEDTCPYNTEETSTERQGMGYVKVGEQSYRYLAFTFAEILLHEKPILANVELDNKFSEYGGGVDELAECIEDYRHSMLLIGSGREDGKEYWLFRNSHGTDWGEEGYYKLSKQSKCVNSKFEFTLIADFKVNFHKGSDEKSQTS